jgi:hypothetical protein
MNQMQKETRAAPCCFVFLLLALSFGSLASNAAPQVLKGNVGRTPCRINSINTATGVVTAKVNSSGQSFRFLVKDAALLHSLRDGQEIFADFNAQEVFTSAVAGGQVVRLGGILTDNSGKPPAGPAVGANPPQKVEGAQPAAPGSGTNPQANKILQPNKVGEPAASGSVANPAGKGGDARPAGPGGGSNPQPNKMGGGTNPAGPGATGGQPKRESAPVAPGGPPGAIKGAGPPIKIPAPAQIHNFAVVPGPILGGQNDLGRVDLTGVPPSGATVQISSDHPSVASVSAPVQVPSQGTAAVVVKTQPVLQSTDVVLSAQVAGSSQVVTAKLTVRPPQVSFLSCLPNTMPSGTPIPCKVILEGPAPGISVTNAKTGSTSSAVAREPAAHQSGMLVQVSTNNSQVASVPGGGVLVPAGASSAQFELPTTAYPEPVDVIISASYQGPPSQTATVTLTPAAIRTFGCVQGVVPTGTVGAESCETVTDRSNTSIVINFSGPTPAGFVTVSSDSQVLLICDPPGGCGRQSVTLPSQTGAQWEARGVWPNGVLVPTTATLSVQDPLSNIVKTVQIKVDPPSPTSIQFRSTFNAPFVTAISGVLTGGQQVQAVVRMNSSWPVGLTFDVKYAASDAAGNPLPGAISGPPQIVLSTSNVDPALQYCFDITGITVQPCEVNSPCKVSVTVGTATGTLSVNP